MAIDTEDLTDKIRAKMLALGFNQVTLAEKMGVTQAALSQILSQKRTPNTDMILKLADALGTSTDYLLRRTSSEEIFDILRHDQALKLVRTFLSLSQRDRDRVVEMIQLLRDTGSAQ